MINETLFPINFSATMLTDLHLCELSWFRKHCQRLVGQSRSGDLIAGSHIAKACELTRKAFFNDGKDAEDSIDIGKTFILEAEDTTHDLKSNERVAMCFERYFKKFKLTSELKPVKLEDGTYAIEYLFNFDLGIPHPEIVGQNICLKGKLDGLYWRKTLAGIENYVLDEKTTGSIRRLPDGTPDWYAEENEFNTSAQFIIYHWSARKLGVKTTRSLIRRIPILVKFEESFELSLPINQFMLDRWEQSTIAKIQELISKYKWLKANGGLPQQVFYPIYNEGCNNFKKPCYWKAGCISKEGEEEIASKTKQVVYIEGKEIALIDYKKSLNLI